MTLSIADQAKLEQSLAERDDRDGENSMPLTIQYTGHMPPRTYNDLLDTVNEIMADDEHPMPRADRKRMLGRVAYIGRTIDPDAIVAQLTFNPVLGGGMIDLPEIRIMDLYKDLGLAIVSTSYGYEQDTASELNSK